MRTSIWIVVALINTAAGCGAHVQSDTDAATTAIVDGAGQDAAADGSDHASLDAATADAADPGMLLFSDDFESGSFKPQWSGVQFCGSGSNNDRLFIYSTSTGSAADPVPEHGTHAAHFHVLDTDVDTNSACDGGETTDNPRSQLLTAFTLLEPGEERWESWSTYFPTSLPAVKCPAGSTTAQCDGAYLLFEEDYGPPYNKSPWIAWDVLWINNENQISLQISASPGNPQSQWSEPVPTGRWIKFLVHKKLSTTATGGLMEAWVDGNPVTFKSCNCTTYTGETMNPDQNQPGDGFFLDSYRAHGMFTSADLYHDNAKVGTTRASVE
jgi:hypothetical protein